MEIVCVPAAFARWRAEVVEDGQVYGVGIGQRPGCAIRDAINDFCLKYSAMPVERIQLTVSEWE